jgi:hypothetical protein
MVCMLFRNDLLFYKSEIVIDVLVDLAKDIFELFKIHTFKIVLGQVFSKPRDFEHSFDSFHLSKHLLKVGRLPRNHRLVCSHFYLG